MAGAAFVWVSEPRTRSFLLRKSLKNLGSLKKISFACFVDLEKAYDRVPREKFYKVPQEYGIKGQLLHAIKSFYCQRVVCVRVNSKKFTPFRKSVGLRQGYTLPPLLFIVHMKWIDKCSHANKCSKIDNCKISRLLFANDLVLLSSTEPGLQHPLNSFAAARDPGRKENKHG